LNCTVNSDDTQVCHFTPKSKCSWMEIQIKLQKKFKTATETRWSTIYPMLKILFMWISWKEIAINAVYHCDLLWNQLQGRNDPDFCQKVFSQ
jgi:hypothetical protein